MATEAKDAPPVSVVVRARDEARAIGRTLELLSRQTVPAQVIVVDSGSRDDTVAIARAAGAEIIEIPAREFSYGGALNAGAELARAPVIAALSAHAFPRSLDWLAALIAHFADPQVACACGERFDGAFRPLTAPLHQDAALFDANPFWGYSNSAGAFRAELWRRRPFRADMPGTEDREWSRWALGEGYVCVLDPALVVDHDHSGEGLVASYRRYRREYEGFAMFLELEPYGPGALVREWWRDQGGHRSIWRARLDPRRLARLGGKWRGRNA